MNSTEALIRLYRVEDLEKVVQLIAEHDQDDADSAEDTLNSEDCINWVSILDSEIVGVSGYERVRGTDKSSYLSWTYVAKERCGHGIGTQLLDVVLGHAKSEDCRLMLVKVSDYIEPGKSVSLYDTANRLYIKSGFERQIYCNDFYDEGEGIEIMSLRLRKSDPETLKLKDEKPRLEFCGLREIAETKGAYTFDWRVPSGLSVFTKRNFSVNDIEIGLSAASTAGARAVFLTFPSNLPLIHKPLQLAGFKYLGEIKDYYEDGLNEMHFIYQFK